VSLRTPAQLGMYGGLVVSALVLLPLAWWLAYLVMSPLSRLLRALEGAVASYRDGDFSFSIAARRSDELGELIRMHNALGQTLREQRQHLVQRELLLETVVQNTPVALVLTDGKGLNGLDFTELLTEAPEALSRAVQGGEDALLSVEMDGSEETFHLSQRAFRLQG